MSIRALPRWRRILFAATTITMVLAQLGVAEARPWGAVGRASEVRYSSAPTVSCQPWLNSSGTPTRVCFHWVTSGTHSTVPSWVVDTRAAFRDAWDSQVVGVRMPTPLADGGSSRDQGPNTGFDVYIAALPEGELGYCDYDRRPDADGDGPNDNRGDGGDGRIAAYCVIDNDFAAVTGTDQDRLDELQGTAAHEFFHALQYAADYGTAGWVSEGTAAWSEGQVFPALDTNHRYLDVSALQNPDDAFDLSGSGYGAWLFWQYVSERFEATAPSPVKRFWTATRARSDTRRDSTSESLGVLQSVTGAAPADMMAQFGSWNYRVIADSQGQTGATYAEADQYFVALGGKRPPADAVYELDATRPDTDATGANNALRSVSTSRPSVHYIRFESPDGGQLAVTVDLPSSTKARVLVESAGTYATESSIGDGATKIVELEAGEAAILVLASAATSARTIKYRASVVDAP